MPCTGGFRPGIRGTDVEALADFGRLRSRHRRELNGARPAGELLRLRVLVDPTMITVKKRSAPAPLRNKGPGFSRRVLFC
jgi:hypothetical protein